MLLDFGSSARLSSSLPVPAVVAGARVRECFSGSKLRESLWQRARGRHGSQCVFRHFSLRKEHAAQSSPLFLRQASSRHGLVHWAVCTSPQAGGPGMFKSQERQRRLRGLRVDGAGRWRLKLSVVRAQLHSLITTGRVMALAVVEPEAVVGMNV